MFHLVLTYFAEYVDKRLFENVLSYSISFSYIFLKCFICSISFHSSSVTVAQPFYSPFSMMSYCTLIVSSETVFSDKIQFQPSLAVIQVSLHLSASCLVCLENNNFMCALGKQNPTLSLSVALNALSACQTSTDLFSILGVHGLLLLQPATWLTLKGLATAASQNNPLFLLFVVQCATD